jgi:crotonobetainyl-CoA:carnitine CoA-transferase CaiB-like acyl-CoA transferase
VTLTGQEPALPSSFAIGTIAQTSIAAAALAAAEIARTRRDIAVPPRVRVDMRHAAIEFRSERYARIDDNEPPPIWDRIAGLYACADGHVRLHTNFPHHRDGILALLGCENAREAVAAALTRWRAVDLEDAAATRGLVATATRSPAAWRAHPQAAAVAAEPLVAIEQIGDATPQAMSPHTRDERPLDGVRVLDLTRIIAGPVCGRTLAAHGAEVLAISAAHLPSIPSLVIDTGRGKRTAHLDLRDTDARTRLDSLIRGADVFVQGYRPGTLAARGYAPERLASLRPGMVCVSLAAYGFSGPWAARRGFDSLVQNATGINVAEAEAFAVMRPKELPCQALDHAAGQLMAFGAMIALLRRSERGGSWHVRVSLARVGRWLEELGRITDGPRSVDPAIDDVRDLLETTPSGFGALIAVRHAGLLEATPQGWMHPAMPLGSHTAEWTERS